MEKTINTMTNGQISKAILRDFEVGKTGEHADFYTVEKYAYDWGMGYWLVHEPSGEYVLLTYCEEGSLVWEPLWEDVVLDFIQKHAA